MMELVKPQRGTSWTSILTGMQPGETLPASIEYRNTVAPLISRQLKLSHPDMAWETKKEDEITLKITRIK